MGVCRLEALCWLLVPQMVRYCPPFSLSRAVSAEASDEREIGKQQGREPEDGPRTPDGSESGQPDSIVSDRRAQWGDLVLRRGKSRDFLF